MRQYRINERDIQQAWVVFSGESELRWLKFLKPGYRHCFLLLNDGQCWVSYDPMSHHTDIIVHHMPVFFDLPGWLAGRGHKVVKTELCKSNTRPAPFGFFSCVEAVKRALGIHALRVQTPWQLYRHLEHKSNTTQKETFHGKPYLTA